MLRSEILAEAERCVCGKREQDYGSPEDNFSTIGRFWTTFLQARYTNAPEITAEDVSDMMALLKLARIAKGHSIDSFVDLAGYAACAGEIATEQNCTYEVKPSYEELVPDGGKII